MFFFFFVCTVALRTFKPQQLTLVQKKQHQRIINRHIAGGGTPTLVFPRTMASVSNKPINNSLGGFIRRQQQHDAQTSVLVAIREHIRKVDEVRKISRED